MQDLGFGQAGEVDPSEINDSGTVAGISKVRDRPLRLSYQDGVTFINGFPEPTTPGRGANGINDAGQVTGAFAGEAFLWDPVDGTAPRVGRSPWISQTPSGSLSLRSFQTHLAGRTAGAARAVSGGRCSMGCFGFFVPGRSGRSCRAATRHTRRATATSSSGAGTGR